MENFHAAGERVLIVANHASFLDPVLLWAFLPENITFAINTHIATRFWVKPALRFARVFPMDPTQPISLKTLTHHIRQNRKAVLFPEGRITVTGSLMKIYDGAAMVAERAGAKILPVRIDGAQYTPFSRLRGIVPLRWFPTISLNILPPQSVDLRSEATGDDRRRRLGTFLGDIMSEMVFATGNHRRTVFSALLEARNIHGGRRIILEDMQRQPLSYDALITRCMALRESLAGESAEGEVVGLLLPNVTGTVAAVLGLQVGRRVPALLNYSAGVRNMLAACKAARIGMVVTSRQFVEKAKLDSEIGQMAEHLRIVYLEDLVAALNPARKSRIWLRSHRARIWGCEAGEPDACAVVLFTSGSEGVPKGVALSHANLLANCDQITANLDFNAQDVILNVLPLFHSFGFTAGTLLPLLSGMRNFLYPSPLHYRAIPEVAYDINATVLFATNTFLAAYARSAHPYDFYSVRYVFAGAEKLQPETRKLWSDKFGLRILEGYGVTETSPALAVNTPMQYRAGTVGRLMPGIRYRIEPVPGFDEGGRLHVSGPNVMLGYLLHDQPGRLIPPASVFGEGWHDTGDLADVDDEGFVTIKGRFKRFAKIAGEMVSLAMVEELAARLWPGYQHAAITLPDPKKGEQIV
ncbi:MAG: acyl-(acyl-carrier-protein)--phospholipid O-acyltransferase, partial [Proteobacteria bacterium]|nr:acyl-(acyl-carrier-protein)--phospholipid O-acyltransferase [Pseudomonadota bacterium]